MYKFKKPFKTAKNKIVTINNSVYVSYNREKNETALVYVTWGYKCYYILDWDLTKKVENSKWIKEVLQKFILSELPLSINTTLFWENPKQHILDHIIVDE